MYGSKRCNTSPAGRYYRLKFADRGEELVVTTTI
jgi:hypothetical protein